MICTAEYKLILVLVLGMTCSTLLADAHFHKNRIQTSVVTDSTDSLAVRPISRQDTAFMPRDNQLSLGYGFFPLDGDVVRWVYQSSGSSASIFGPVYLKFEHAINYHWTIGINFAYGHYNITTPSSYDEINGLIFHNEYRVDDTYSLLCRINYHFVMVKRWDPYFGAGLGVRSSSSTYATSDNAGPAPVSYDNKFPVGFETTFGVRYIVSDFTSFYAEVGLAKSVLQVGLSYKLKTKPELKKAPK